MHIIFGIVLFLTWLYWWLLGHWFARIVGAIVLVPALACVAALIGYGLGASNPLAIIAALAGAYVGWLAASAPVRFWSRYV